ncbi:MAG: LysR family transcriptional regulator [Bacteroidota bacterium]
MITGSNQIELRHLRYFLAVAEELHFGRAAEKLFISQPGLSRQIKQLEEELDLQLFERDNRNVALTQAGHYLKEEVQLLLKNLQKVFNHASMLQDGKEGILKFGYVGSAMQNIIPQLLLEFRETHPNIQFDFKEMDNQKQVESLLSQDIDVGFVRLVRVPRGLQIKPVFKDTFSLVLPNSHPLEKQDFSSLIQLKDEPFILFERAYSPTYYEKMRQIFDYSGFTPIVSHFTVHASTIYRLVENHFGVSIVPSALKMGYDMDVKFIELTEIPQRTTLSIVWNQQNRNPILEKLLEVVELFELGSST